MYAKIKDQKIVKYPYSSIDLEKDNPNTSFSDNMSDQELLDFGVVRVFDKPVPVTDHTKTIREIEPELIDGFWTQTWEITDASAGEIEVRTERRAADIRLQRDRRLNETVDLINAVRWAAMTEQERTAWTDYRQALLDIPAQPGFPWSVEWPATPGSDS